MKHARRSKAGRIAAALAASMAVAIGATVRPVSATSGSTEWDEIIAAAEDEGKVTIYSSQGVPELGELESRFEEAYDIDLVVVRGLPQDLVPRIEVERQTGRGEADVYVSADQRWVVQADTDGYYVDHAGPAFENPDYDQETGTPNGTYFKSNAVIFGFGWNTDEVPDGLTGYADLLDPSLADGRVGVVEAANETLVDFYVYLEEEMGEEYVADLAAQNPRIYPGAAAINEALASNEIAAAVYTGASLRDTQAEGAPVDFAYPETIFGANFWGGVLSSAPNPNAAQVLADFMVTQSGQEALARNGASVLPGVGGTETEIENVRQQDLDQLTPDFVTEYIAEWRELFQ
ncbi:ABC transporter substrate-binding protein [Desertimonas flava]|uniref:ABC transporter substrate-binding protein n=1 Tax=Desertimonas flava TaxID=2064846 RepID=UPI000E350CE8|nr:extracellular solute-binding protein [Desertimonas flava]